MSKEEKSIGIGLIGISMGDNTLEVNLDPDSRFIVRGLCSATKQKVEALAKKWDIGFATTDYRDLLKRDDIQVIAIYTPDDQHYEQAIASLEAGKDIIVTKPLATELEHAKEIAEMAHKKGRKVIIGQTLRFQSSFLGLKKLIDDGDLGEILFAHSHYYHDMRPLFTKTSWRTKKKDFLIGTMVHPIDIVRWILGDIDEVSACARKSPLLPMYKKESLFSLNFKFKNGAIGNVFGLYGIVQPPEPQFELSVYGTKGSASCDYGDFKDEHLQVVFDKLNTKPKLLTTYPACTEGSYGSKVAVLNYMRQFEECILENKEPSPNAYDALNAFNTSLAAWESVRTGRPVKVNNMSY